MTSRILDVLFYPVSLHIKLVNVGLERLNKFSDMVPIANCVMHLNCQR